MSPNRLYTALTPRVSWATFALGVLCVLLVLQPLMAVAQQPSTGTEHQHAPVQPSRAVRPGQEALDRLRVAYMQAIATAIERQWVRPTDLTGETVCKVRIRQEVGGRVLSAWVDPSCPYDPPGRHSVEAAVLKAQPLPYAGFEPVFEPHFILAFRAGEP